MAEGIVIEVSDGVAGTIQAKIRGIGDEARSAADYVDKLRSAVNAIGNADPVAKLQSQMDSLNIAQARLATATTQGATAQARLQAAQTGTATAAQRLATAQQQTASATSNAAAAADKAALAQLQLAEAHKRAEAGANGASSAIGSFFARFVAVASVVAAVREVLKLADAYTVLQNKLGTVSGSQAQTNELTAAIFDIAQRTSVGVGEVASSFTRFDRALQPLGKSQAEVLRMTETINKALLLGGATSQEAAGALLQLSQGFNAGKLQGDEFRSVAENMPSLLKAVAEVMGVSSSAVKRLGSEGKITSEVMFKATLLMQESTDAAFGKMQKTMEQAGVNMKNSIMSFIGEVNKSIGLTAAMANNTIDLAGKIDDLSRSTMNGGNGFIDFLKSMGDVYTMAKELVGNAIDAVSTAMDKMKAATGGTGDNMSALEVIGRLVIGAFKGLLIVGNEVITMFGRIADTASTTVDILGAIDRMEFKSIGGMVQGLEDRSKAAAGAAKTFRDSVLLINSGPKFKDSRILGDVGTIAEQNKAAGISNLRGSGRNTVTPDNKAKKGSKKKTPAEEFELIDTKYNNEISSLGMLKPLREDKNALDQIELELLRKNIVLTKAGRDTLSDKITKVREGKVVQAEMDRVLENAIAPQRTYNASLDGASILLSKGAITQKQYGEELRKAGEIYRDAVDPFRQFNKALDDEISLLGLSGTQLELETKMLQYRNDLIKKGTDLTSADTITQMDALRVKILKTQQDTLRKQVREGDSALAGGIGNKLSVDSKIDDLTSKAFDALDRNQALYDQLLQGDETYALRKLAIHQKLADDVALIKMNETQVQLQLGQSTFDSLAGMTESFAGKQNGIYKAMFAASKAMAIADSLVQIQAAMAKALNLPWPLNLGAIATVAAQGASIMANMRAIKDIGFMAGGFTGNGATNQIAGVVHGQEFVVNASATQRHRPMLEAMNAGAADVNANNGSASGKVVMISFEINNNIQTSGGAGDSDADALRKAADTISRKTQSDIMDSIRMGGTWSKVIKQ